MGEEGRKEVDSSKNKVSTGRKTTSYFVQKPTGRRKSFIVRAKTPKGVKPPSISHSIIDTVNAAYQKREITFESALTQLRNFIDTHLKEKKRATPYFSENAEILTKYWDKYYTHKKISDKNSAYNRLRRAIDAVGTLSLRSASEKQIQEAADQASDQRRVISALKTLLKYIGRNDVVLQMERKKRTKVPHLTLSEYNRARAYLPSNILILADVAFATGARQGEEFSIDRVIPSPEEGKYFVWIESQVTRKKDTSETKNRRTRRAPVVSAFNDSVIAWADMPEKEKLELRHIRFAEAIQQAVTKAGIDKKIVWHDLRHSYAIYLISKGASIVRVAQALGNSVAVCQEFYVGFDLSDESLSAVSRLI